MSAPADSPSVSFRSTRAPAARFDGVDSLPATLVALQQDEHSSPSGFTALAERFRSVQLHTPAVKGVASKLLFDNVQDDAVPEVRSDAALASIGHAEDQDENDVRGRAAHMSIKALLSKSPAVAHAQREPLSVIQSPEQNRPPALGSPGPAAKLPPRDADQKLGHPIPEATLKAPASVVGNSSTAGSRSSLQQHLAVLQQGKAGAHWRDRMLAMERIAEAAGAVAVEDQPDGPDAAFFAASAEPLVVALSARVSETRPTLVVAAYTALNTMIRSGLAEPRHMPATLLETALDTALSETMSSTSACCFVALAAGRHFESFAPCLSNSQTAGRARAACEKLASSASASQEDRTAATTALDQLARASNTSSAEETTPEATAQKPAPQSSPEPASESASESSSGPASASASNPTSEPTHVAALAEAQGTGHAQNQAEPDPTITKARSALNAYLEKRRKHSPPTATAPVSTPLQSSKTAPKAMRSEMTSGPAASSATAQSDRRARTSGAQAGVTRQLASELSAVATPQPRQVVPNATARDDLPTPGTEKRNTAKKISPNSLRKRRMFSEEELENARREADVRARLEERQAFDVDMAQMRADLKKKDSETEELQEVLAQFEDTMTVMIQKESKEAKARIEDAEAETQRLKQDLEEMSKTFSSLKARYDETKSFAVESESREARLVEQNKDLKSKMVELQQWSSDLRANTEKKLKSSFDSATQFRAMFLDKEAREAKAQKELEVAVTELRQREESLQEALARVGQLEEENGKLADSLQAAKKSLSMVREECTKSKDATSTHRAEVESAREKLCKAEERISALSASEARAKDAAAKAEKLVSENRELKAKAYDDRTRIEELEESVARKRQENDDLHSICEELVSNLEKAKKP